MAAPHRAGGGGTPPLPVGDAPTRRVASPYTEGRVSLHGGFEFPTRRVWVSYMEKRRSLRGTSQIAISGA